MTLCIYVQNPLVKRIIQDIKRFKFYNMLQILIHHSIALMGKGIIMDGMLIKESIGILNNIKLHSKQRPALNLNGKGIRSALIQQLSALCNPNLISSSPPYAIITLVQIQNTLRNTHIPATLFNSLPIKEIKEIITLRIILGHSNGIRTALDFNCKEALFISYSTCCSVRQVNISIRNWPFSNEVFHNTPYRLLLKLFILEHLVGREAIYYEEYE